MFWPLFPITDTSIVGMYRLPFLWALWSSVLTRRRDRERKVPGSNPDRTMGHGVISLGKIFAIYFLLVGLVSVTVTRHGLKKEQLLGNICCQEFKVKKNMT